MTGMNLWPTLITGAVGVAGIVGTILAAQLTARSQAANLMITINAETDRARVADKRQVYANFISALNELSITTLTENYKNRDAAKKPGAYLDRFSAGRSVYVRLSELELVGSKEVISSAREISDLVTNLLDEFGEDGASKDTALLESFIARATSVEEQLYNAMRIDLGIKSDWVNGYREKLRQPLCGRT